jgi:undecaprenyl diphosphate synthase
MSNSQTPKHIGFIMDGNRRWAKQNQLSTLEGHTAGSKALGALIEECTKLGVETVTVYALSTENLEKRMKSELKGIFGLLSNWISKKQDHLNKNGINLQFFGKLDQLPKSLQRKMNKITEVLKHNERIKLNVLLNYGGRAEIVESVKQIIKDGTSAADINEELISQNLYTKNLPDPDLIIRTGGQKRISNFLVWQMSYSELYFTDTLWPDFDSNQLHKALTDYSSRSRRFGGQDKLKVKTAR